MPLNETNYWDQSTENILEKLKTQIIGLTESEVLSRQKQYGLNIIHKSKINIFTIFFRQITSNPLLIILAIATFISFMLGEKISSFYIFGMIIVSIALGLWNEYSRSEE